MDRRSLSVKSPVSDLNLFVRLTSLKTKDCIVNICVLCKSTCITFIVFSLFVTFICWLIWNYTSTPKGFGKSHRVSSEAWNCIYLRSFSIILLFLTSTCLIFSSPSMLNVYSCPKAFRGLCACCLACLTITESTRERPWLYLHTRTFIHLMLLVHTLAYFHVSPKDTNRPLSICVLYTIIAYFYT